MFHVRSGYVVGLVLLCGLIGGPAGGATDAWAQFSLVSVATDSGSANGTSSTPEISADGRFVAFTSAATNLVANDANASRDVFVRDRQTNVTTRVSVTSAGAEAAGHSELGAITPDGRFVVFQSHAALVSGDTIACDTPADAPTCSDIYVHDRQTNTTTRVSVTSVGEQANNHSSAPSISADGRYVAFASTATNLFGSDTNDRSDVFLHDRVTNVTTRISVNDDGSQMPGGGTFPMISEDGEVIVYSGHAPREQLTDPESTLCDTSTNLCVAMYLRLRSTGEQRLLSNAFPAAVSNPPTTVHADSMRVYAMNADGRFIVIEQLGFIGKQTAERTLIHDRVTNRTTDASYVPSPPRAPDLSSDGRTLAHSIGVFNSTPGWSFSWTDRTSGFTATVSYPTPNPRHVMDVSLSADGRYTAFATTPPDTDPNQVLDIYVYDRDAGDSDGLPDAWETLFGLNPATAADTAVDPDLDGVTNLQEFQRGSHPTATHARYFAEGAANAFFRTRFAALNPGDTSATVVFRYLGSGGEVSSRTVVLPAKSRLVEIPNQFSLIPNDFSTVVESNQPIVVDRTMLWGFETVWGGHAETSLAGPSTTWYLAEGATHGAFDLFYLLQNPNPTDANVTVNYLRLDPATPVVKTYTVPANSRKTIWVDDEGAELAAVDVGASITSDLPIVVERAMYSTRPGQPAFAAGHGGAGVTAPAPKWFLAEGATGNFFDLYLLIANPNAATSDVKVTYLLGNGSNSFSKTYTVGARTRRTLSIKDEDPRLADTAVSMIVETTNNQPLVVERAMWWPRDQWYEAHLSAGATTTGTRWAIADGEVAPLGATDNQWETYILIANTSATDGTATVTLVREDETGGPIVQLVSLPANSRVNVPVSAMLAAHQGSKTFSAIVESNGVEIVVERAMYQSVGGVTWSIGTAALATKLQ